MLGWLSGLSSLKYGFYGVLFVAFVTMGVALKISRTEVAMYEAKLISSTHALADCAATNQKYQDEFDRLQQHVEQLREDSDNLHSAAIEQAKKLKEDENKLRIARIPANTSCHAAALSALSAANELNRLRNSTVRAGSTIQRG